MAQIGQEIVNPRTGQRVQFVETASASAGARLVLECVSPSSAEREPEHVHPYQTSRFAVHRGALRFRIAGLERVVVAGEEVSIPPGTPHHFWVEGSESAEYRQVFEPALDTEAFFEALFGLAQAGRLSRSGMPPVLLLGVFGQTFWSTVRVTRPPRWLQRLTYAVLGPFGRLLGQRLPAARGEV